MEFEKKIKELEKIVEKLGGGELSLEGSLKAYEKGIKLSRECSEQLNKADEKIKTLSIDPPDDSNDPDDDSDDDSEDADDDLEDDSDNDS